MKKKKQRLSKMKKKKLGKIFRSLGIKDIPKNHSEMVEILEIMESKNESESK